VKTRDGSWPDPTWASLWPTENKGLNWLWPGYSLTQPNQIFFDQRVKKLKNWKFWGKFSRPDQSNKKNDLNQVKFIWPGPITIKFWTLYQFLKETWIKLTREKSFHSKFSENTAAASRLKYSQCKRNKGHRWLENTLLCTLYAQSRQLEMPYCMNKIHLNENCLKMLMNIALPPHQKGLNFFPLTKLSLKRSQALNRTFQVEVYLWNDRRLKKIV